MEGAGGCLRLCPLGTTELDELAELAELDEMTTGDLVTEMGFLRK